VAKKRQKADETLDPATAAFNKAAYRLSSHPMFRPIFHRVSVVREEGNRCPPDGWAVVRSNGSIHVHPRRRATPEEWEHVLAHCLLHLGFGHVREHDKPILWNVACDLVVAGFLADLKIGRRPEDVETPAALPGATEEAIFKILCERGVPPELSGCGTAGPAAPDMDVHAGKASFWYGAETWEQLLAWGLRAAVTAAVDVAGGLISSISQPGSASTSLERARSWFLSHYPLLGALAGAFTLIEDAAVCERMDIRIAAVDAEAREIYFNPRAMLNELELHYVMAHELLHVSLRHQARRQGRDPYLWNVACDYVINGWLLEMKVGTAPKLGQLHDPDLAGLSAEAVYDLIVTDLRRYRKLMTLRGVGVGDILERKGPPWWETGDGRTLDDFYRQALSQGLLYHQEQCRGFLPAGLVEEINALSQPPIPWDVELAQWFDHHFPPREKRRTYARPSRRQSATPDIPRPRVQPLDDGDIRTFAVLLDTSGSMDRKLLGKALGAITSYSVARDVDLVRLVYCDAQPYDQGYVRPEEIAAGLTVKGRGGTVLQPALDLLDRARDFPDTGPVLIITDGWCDPLRIRREHAVLVPPGASLPFVPRGPVFWVR
jgi:predicted metal-dependent peptidase